MHCYYRRLELGANWKSVAKMVNIAYILFEQKGQRSELGQNSKRFIIIMQFRHRSTQPCQVGVFQKQQ